MLCEEWMYIDILERTGRRAGNNLQLEVIVDGKFADIHRHATAASTQLQKNVGGSWNAPSGISWVHCGSHNVLTMGSIVDVWSCCCCAKQFKLANIYF